MLCHITIVNAQEAIGHALIRVFDKPILLYDKSHKPIDTIICSVENDLLYSVAILKIKNHLAYINAYCFHNDVEIEKKGWIYLKFDNVWIMILLYSGLTVLFYFLSVRILNKKLELQ